MRIHGLCVVAAMLLGPTTVAAGQTTWVVDDQPGPGVQFTSLQAAVDAAANGDVLAVQPGSYAPFVLDGKALRIVGAGSTATTVAATADVIVRNVPAGWKTSVQGLRFVGHVRIAPIAGACSSNVDVADCNLGRGLAISSTRVHLHRCTVAWTGVSAAGAGILLMSGRLVVSSCTIDGGDGTAPFGGGPGAAGISVGALFPGFPPIGSGAVRIYESTVRGGDAGVGFGAPFPNAGGAGVTLAHAGCSAAVYGVGCLIVGGAGSPGGGGTAPGAPGPAIQATSGATAFVYGGAATPTVGAVVVSPAPFAALSASGPWTTAATATLTVSLPPPAGAGVPFAVGVALDGGFTPLPSPFFGEWVLAGPAVPLVDGVLDASGQATFVFAGAAMPPALLYQPLHLQVVTLDAPAGLRRLGQPTWMMLAP